MSSRAKAFGLRVPSTEELVLAGVFLDGEHETTHDTELVLSIVLDAKSKRDDLGSVAVGAPAAVATFGGSTGSFDA